jgi:hypothetical protein
MNMPRCILNAEVPGHLGNQAVYSSNANGWVVTTMHLEFDDWMGDDIVQVLNCFLATEKAKQVLTEVRLTGFVFEESVITKSDEFIEQHPEFVLPKFWWLRPDNESGSDVFIYSDGNLALSEKAMIAITKLNLRVATIKTPEPNRRLAKPVDSSPAMLRAFVPGRLGLDVQMSHSKSDGWNVTKMHLDFDEWLGDDIVQVFNCFLVTDKAKQLLETAQLKGFTFEEPKITKSYEFAEKYPSLNLPNFWWLRPARNTTDSDFAIHENGFASLSHKAMETLSNLSLLNAIFIKTAESKDA